MQKLSVESELAQLSVNTIRFLCVDMVEKAKSGHPGMPCGAADYAFVLWSKFLRYDPITPRWPNRDRFVLSAGHGSTLLYSLLHLAGNPEITLDELKSFRQWGSKTPGHPEADVDRGIETTTGPLGQGFANGVGMAIAGKMMAARFNKPGYDIIDHHVYGIVSDGDLMEGISHEAASIAGHLGLGNLIYIYDDNKISIEGSTDIAFSEDIELRFKSYGWQVLKVDGHNRREIDSAIASARTDTSRPTIIIAKTHIGCCAPTKQDTKEAHGEPFGHDEVTAMKNCLNWPLEPDFYVPNDVKSLWAEWREDRRVMRSSWEEMFKKYRSEYPDLAKEWDEMQNRQVPQEITDQLLASVDTSKEMATRASGGLVLQEAAKLVPSLCGGSADLAPSTKTWIKGFDAIEKGGFSGRNFHFGIREHAMGSIMNGMALYGGFIPFGSTFFTFSDYTRPTHRIAAINKSQVIYVYTHDSFFVGEDGPTHQPIEHLASLRAIPGVTVIRPADAAETAVAWAAALKNASGPTVLVLSRQNLPPVYKNSPEEAKWLEKGAYVVSDSPEEKTDVILIATGSEVSAAIKAQKLLAPGGINCRVVSMPSFELFEAQSKEYRDSVLPPSITSRVAIEAASPFGWERYTGCKGIIIGMDHFGASAPAGLLAEKFGFTPEAIAARVRKYLNRGCCCCGC
ncbi:MAG: transketolase [Armatimonadota bacterium]